MFGGGSLQRIFRVVFACVFSIFLSGLAAEASADNSGHGRIVVANRGSSSLSVIDVKTDQVVDTIVMPNNGEPMYLAFSPQRRRLFVADRANSQAVVFKLPNLEFETTVPAGAGTFHCWIDPTEKQLWISNDVANTATVIDTVTLEVITTVDMPQDLVEAGYKPHDVNLPRVEDSAYVTLIAGGQPGFVVKYSTNTFQEVARRELGGDPHVSLPHQQSHLLYVMSQEAGLVYALRRNNLQDFVPPLDVPGAHGAVMNRSYRSRFLYTTNLPGGGINGLVTIDRRKFEVVGQTDTIYPTPHNIAVTPNGRKLYLSHSGAASDVVTVYDIDRRTGIPSHKTEVKVELNPFGLTYIP